MTGKQVVIVNAVTMRDLELFTVGLLRAEAEGKRFLYRTAASFVQVRVGQAPTPLLTAADLQLPPNGGGLIVAGSYVPKTTRQLKQLMVETAVHPIEISVEKLLDETRQTAEIERTSTLADQLLAQGQDVVIFTSRELVQERDGRSGLAVGNIISQSLVQIVQQIQNRPRYFVAKGGITSSDIATQALGIRRTMAVGQVLPGVPVWRLGPNGRYPHLPYIVFPGNVGGDDALVKLVHLLATK